MSDPKRGSLPDELERMVQRRTAEILAEIEVRALDRARARVAGESAESVSPDPVAVAPAAPAVLTRTLSARDVSEEIALAIAQWLQGSGGRFDGKAKDMYAHICRFHGWTRSGRPFWFPKNANSLSHTWPRFAPALAALGVSVERVKREVTGRSHVLYRLSLAVPEAPRG